MLEECSEMKRKQFFFMERISDYNYLIKFPFLSYSLLVILNFFDCFNYNSIREIKKFSRIQMIKV